MGWTCFSRPPAGGMLAAIDEAIGRANVVESAIAADGNYYAAVSVNADEVVAVVGLIEGHGYKLMDEAMGPYYYACPASILARLTPTKHPFARKWRAHCADLAA